MDYPKSIPGVGLVDGHFVDENPATGQVGSLIPAAWGDAITQEILNVIKAAGMAPSESNVSQLAAAVQAIAASDVKRSVLVATTGPIALSGLQSIDGVAVPAGARVLVKNQANAAQNWIYMASAGPWLRAQDADDSAKCTPGHLIGVQSGTANAGAVWQLANTAIPVLGTTALAFTLAIGKTGVVAGEYRRVAVDALGRVTAGSNPDTLAGYGITDAASKNELSSGLAGKANNATTLSGYGITDGATKDHVNNAVSNLLSKSGGKMTGTIILDNGSNDSPEISWQTPGFDIRADVVNKTLRFFALNDGATTFPFELDVANKVANFFGNTAWHAGNFNPQDKANKAVTLAGYGIADGATKKELSDGLSTKAHYSTIFNNGPIAGASSRLKLTADGNSCTVYVSVEEITLKHIEGNYRSVGALSGSVNLLASGANGLDTGTVEASRWYSIWMIEAPGVAFALLASLSDTAPVMPAGYTGKARLGYVRTDNTANRFVLPLFQNGKKAQLVPGVAPNLPTFPLIVSGINGALSPITLVPVSVAAYVPPGAASVSLTSHCANAPSATVLIHPNSAVSGNYFAPSPLVPMLYFSQNVGNPGNYVGMCTTLNMNLQSMNICVAINHVNSGISVSGWELY